MHSSRMHTAHLLAVSHHALLGVYLLGVYLPRGYTCQGVYLPKGVYLPRGGVPAQGVYLRVFAGGKNGKILETRYTIEY